MKISSTGRRIVSPGLSAFAFVVVALVAITGGCNKQEHGAPEAPAMTPRLRKMIEEARSGTRFMESDGLWAEPVSSEELQMARTYIARHPDVSSYRLLMVLRKQSRTRYAQIPDETKVRVLCDALTKVASLNDWGYLDTTEPYDGEAARAVLELGRKALPYLEEILPNTEEAPIFGSQGATMAFYYHYRRCDYAYRYMMVILGRNPTFPADPKERDKLIAALKRELSRSGK